MNAVKLGIVSLLAISQMACSSWPHYGQGGEADRFAASHFYEPAPTLHESQAYLLTQLEALQAQLDVLTLQGAQFCIPASVKKMTLLSYRVRREIQGRLWADAAHNLVVLQHELRFFRQQFYSVAEQTGCQGSPANQVVVSQPIFSIYFDIDKSEISQVYQQQLSWWAQNFDAQTVLKIQAYTDAHGSDSANVTLAEARLNSVASLLLAQGIDKQHMQLEAFGERELILQGQDEFSEGMNRRVDILVQVQAAAADTVPVNQWEDSGLKTPRYFVPSWY